MKKTLCRAISLALSLQLAASACLADAAQSSVWGERRKNTETLQHSQLAALPVPPPQIRSVLDGLPRPQSAALSPSIENELSRAASPAVRTRIEQAVRAIPASAATVREVTAAPDRDARVIVHVQDVHLNDEAQANIATVVRALADAAGANVVALEGAFEPVDLSKARAMPDKTALKAASDYFLGAHRISGPVHAGLTMEKEAAFVGVDDRAAYDANVAAYRRAEPQRARAKERAEALDRDLARRKGETFSPALQRFDAGVRAYDKGLAPLSDYIGLLSRDAAGRPASIEAFLAAHALEAKLDFARVEAERSKFLTALIGKLSAPELDDLMRVSVDYRLGRTGHGPFYAGIRSLAERHGVKLAMFPAMDAYVRYVLLSDGIRPQDLFRDIEDLRTAGYRALAATPAERALVEESERLALASKLLDFALTPDEWRRYRLVAAGRLAALGDLAPFETFYEQAEKRNDALTANLLKAMDRAGAHLAVLVTGGFHGPGVSERLARAGVSTITVVPRLTHVDGDGTAYLGVFTQEKTPLDKLFEGPKLFLAPHPGTAAAIEGEALVSAVIAAQRAAIDPAALRGWLRQRYGVEMGRVGVAGNGAVARFVEGSSGRAMRVTVARRPDGAYEVTEFGPDLSFAAHVASLFTGTPTRQALRVALNTNVLAFAITAVLGAVGFSVFGAVALPAVVLIFIVAKIFLTLSVAFHEGAHLWADGKLRGLSPLAAARLALGALNQPNLLAAVLRGTDIVDADVPIQRRGAAVSGSRERARLEFVYRAGPVATGILVGVGALLVLAGFVLGNPDVDHLALGVSAVGAILAAVNAVVLFFNFRSSEDWRGPRNAGVNRIGAFGGRLEPDRSSSIENGASINNVLFSPGGETRIEFNASGTRGVIMRTGNGTYRLLIAFQGLHQDLELEDGHSYFLGRLPENDLQSANTSLSRFHLQIRIDPEGRFTLSDLYSRNGTSLTVVAAAEPWQKKSAEAGPVMASSESLLLSAAEASSYQREEANAFSGVQVNPISPEGADRNVIEAQLLQPGIDATPDQRKQLAFFKEYLKGLLGKHDNSADEAWKAQARVGILAYFREAQRVAGGETFQSQAITAFPFITTNAGFRRNVQVATSVNMQSVRLSMSNDNPFQVVIRTDRNGRLLTLGAERKDGDRVYAPRNLVSPDGAFTVVDGKINLSRRDASDTGNLDVASINLAHNAAVDVVEVTLVLKDQSVRRFFFTPNAATGAIRITEIKDRAAAPAVARVAPPAPAPAAPREIPVAERNRDALSGEDFDLRLNAALTAEGAAAGERVTLALVAGADGGILYVGEAGRMPPELQARIFSGELLSTTLLVRNGPLEGPFFALGARPLPSAARAVLEETVAAENVRRAAVDAALNQAGRQALERATAAGADALVAANLSLIQGDGFERVFGSESAGTDQAGFGYAAVNGVADADGRIVAFGNSQHLDAAVRRRADMGELFYVTIAFKVMGAMQAPQYRLLRPSVHSSPLPPAAQIVMEASVAAANAAHALDARRGGARREAVAPVAIPNALALRNAQRLAVPEIDAIAARPSNAKRERVELDVIAGPEGEILWVGERSGLPLDMARLVGLGQAFRAALLVRGVTGTGFFFVLGPSVLPDAVREALTAAINLENARRTAIAAPHPSSGESEILEVLPLFDLRYQRLIGARESDEVNLPVLFQVPVVFGSERTAELVIQRDARTGQVYLEVRDTGGVAIVGKNGRPLPARLPITTRPLLVSRVGGADVQIVSDLVSSRHLTIYLDKDNQVVVEDQAKNFRLPLALTLQATLIRGLAFFQRIGLLALLSRLGLSGLAAPLVRVTYAVVAEARRFYAFDNRFADQHVEEGTFPESARPYLRAFVHGLGAASILLAVALPLFFLGFDFGSVSRLAAAVGLAVLGAALPHAAHFAVNLYFAVSARGPSAAATAPPVARVGESLLAVAELVAAGRGTVNANDLFGTLVRFDIGLTFPGAAALTPGAPAVVDRAALLDYLRAHVDGRLKKGDLTAAQAQVIAEKLSLWLGESVIIGNKEAVTVVRNEEDMLKVETLLSAPGRTAATTVVVDKALAKAAAERFGARANVIVSAAPLFGESGLDFRALEAAIATDPLLAARLTNTVLLVSNQVPFDLNSLPPGSALRQMGFKSLEEAVANLLVPLRVIQLGTMIDAARIVAVQA